jgi:hypothetical protein
VREERAERDDERDAAGDHVPDGEKVDVPVADGDPEMGGERDGDGELDSRALTDAELSAVDDAEGVVDTRGDLEELRLPRAEGVSVLVAASVAAADDDAFDALETAVPLGVPEEH